MIETLTNWLHIRKNPVVRQETRCLCCGDCCESFSGHLHASKADLKRWRDQGREDLLERVNNLGWIWINPKTGRTEERCPFIKRLDDRTVLCAIQETKPDICRDYPTLAHGRRCLHGGFLKVILPVAGCVAGELEATVSMLVQ